MTPPAGGGSGIHRGPRGARLRQPKSHRTWSSGTPRCGRSNDRTCIGPCRGWRVAGSPAMTTARSSGSDVRVRVRPRVHPQRHALKIRGVVPAPRPGSARRRGEHPRHGAATPDHERDGRQRDPHLTQPACSELLELTDRMGFIVLDEAFDMWKKEKTKYDYHLDWDAWHVRDLSDMVRRDRNHPSVFIWSIGNEVMEQWTNDDTTATPIAREAGRDRATPRPHTAHYVSEQQRQSRNPMSMPAPSTARPQLPPRGLAGIFRRSSRGRKFHHHRGDVGAQQPRLLRTLARWPTLSEAARRSRGC